MMVQSLSVMNLMVNQTTHTHTHAARMHTHTHTHARTHVRTHRNHMAYYGRREEGVGAWSWGRGRLYTYRYTVTTRMTSAFRWAAMRAILMFRNCEGQSYKTVSTDHNFWWERRAEADSNWGPSAYQPNALPLGQTGSQPIPQRGVIFYLGPGSSIVGCTVLVMDTVTAIRDRVRLEPAVMLPWSPRYSHWPHVNVDRT